MAKIASYKEVLGVSTEDEIVDDFLSTLSETNRTFDYYVDWEKINRNVDRYTEELSLLNSLLRVDRTEVEAKFRHILTRYPAVLEVLPLLIATRAQELKILEDIRAEVLDVLLYDFTPRALGPADVDRIVHFAKGVGLLDLFANPKITNLIDYLVGVEVGMDTNARKNRSGQAMESILRPLVREIEQGNDNIAVYEQKTLSQLSDLVAEDIPSEIANRKLDFIIAIQEANSVKLINVETNYFGVSGSKEEVVPAYIQRQTYLQQIGADFVLVTDGQGWAQMANELGRAVSSLDWVLNLDFVRRGLLERIILHY